MKMADGSQSRFVSKDFEGVTLIAGERRGQPLLQGRAARIAAQKAQHPVVEQAVTKKSLIQSVAKSTAISHSDASKVVDSVLESIADALKNGQEVRLVGFGTFSISKSHATKKAAVEASRAGKTKPVVLPTFKAGKALKDAVN